MNETRPFLITYHAMQRYCERVHPALPLSQIRDSKAAMNDAKIAIEQGLPTSRLLEVRTNDGREQRRVERPYPCVIVCKEDAGAIVAATVLGPNETILAEDEEIFEAYLRGVRSGVEKGALASLSGRRHRPGESAEEFVRRYVDNQVRASMDKRLESAARSSLRASVALVKTLRGLARKLPDAAFELERIRAEHPLPFEVLDRLEEIAR